MRRSHAYILTFAIDCIASLTDLTRRSACFATRASRRCDIFMILIWIGIERTMTRTPSAVGQPMYTARIVRYAAIW